MKTWNNNDEINKWNNDNENEIIIMKWKWKMKMKNIEISKNDQWNNNVVWK